MVHLLHVDSIDLRHHEALLGLALALALGLVPRRPRAALGHI